MSSPSVQTVCACVLLLLVGQACAQASICTQGICYVCPDGSAPKSISNTKCTCSTGTVTCYGQNQATGELAPLQELLPEALSTAVDGAFMDKGMAVCTIILSVFLFYMV